VQRAFYGPVGEKNATLPDLSVREWCAAAPLVAAAILMGVLPTLFLRPIEPSVLRVVQRVTQSQRVNVRTLPAPADTVVRAHHVAGAATTAAVSEVGLR
jgi:NADH:ubiquinone oxidoreductase subunit 4 (subunit M)